MRRSAAVWILLTWATSVVGVVVSVWLGDWAAVAYALNAAVCAAGWLMQTRRAEYWETYAVSISAAYGLTNPDDD